MLVAMGARQLAEQWQRLQDLAAEHGRTRPIQACAGANISYSPKPVEDEARRPFHGNVAQIVDDLAAHAAAGIPEFLLDLQGTTRDGAELIDVAAEVYVAFLNHRIRAVRTART